MTDKTRETIESVVTLVGVSVGLTALFLGGTVVGSNTAEDKWHKELLSKGYGEYHKKTGRWQLCEPEVVLLNRNTEAIKILNGGQVTVNDYLKIVESDLKDAQKRIEDQAKELIEQDLVLEKYKKSIKIPGESSKISKKSDERPLKSIDMSVILPMKVASDNTSKLK